jgi:hypothetical protein
LTIIRGEDDKGEFFVVVVGTSQNKYFKVKTRMFKALFSRLLTGTVPNDGDPDQNNKSDPVPDRGYVATPRRGRSEAGREGITGQGR